MSEPPLSAAPTDSAGKVNSGGELSSRLIHTRHLAGWTALQRVLVSKALRLGFPPSSDGRSALPISKPCLLLSLTCPRSNISDRHSDRPAGFEKIVGYICTNIKH